MTVHFVRDPSVPLETTDVDHFSGYAAWYVPGISDPFDPEYQGLVLETPEGISIASSLEEVRSAYSVEAGTGRVSVFESRSVFGINDVFPFGDQILFWGLLGPFLDQVETIESGEVCSAVVGV